MVNKAFALLLITSVLSLVPAAGWANTVAYANRNHHYHHYHHYHHHYHHYHHHHHHHHHYHHHDM